MLYRSLLVTGIAFGLAYLAVPTGSSIDSALDAARFLFALVSGMIGIVTACVAAFCFIDAK
jgi:hypothetical protein